jgi:IS1 family transposase
MVSPQTSFWLALTRKVKAKMNTLPLEKKLAVISALVEGNSLRSISRMTGVDRNTINSLLLRTGERCAAIMNERMRNLPCRYLQVDEIWTFVQKKRRNVREGDPAEVGDQWVYVAIDAESKLIPSFFVGKRVRPDTWKFLWDLHHRLANRVQLTTDGLNHYTVTVPECFGTECDFAQLQKLFGNWWMDTPEGKYSPSGLTGVLSKVRQGDPDPEFISTSYVERQNLTMRMAMRRFTRLTNAFSKKLENLKAACALHFAHYNFCRVHGSLRVTPAMAAGVATEIWPLRALLV